MNVHNKMKMEKIYKKISGNNHKKKLFSKHAARLFITLLHKYFHYKNEN